MTPTVECRVGGKPILTAKGEKTFTAMEAGDNVPEFYMAAE
jgi:hypothetical protein